MRKHFAFDVRAAIPAAWDFLWKSNLKRRAEDNKLIAQGKKPFRASETYYLTAADVEAQVRQFAEDTINDRKWGASGRACGMPMSGVRFHGNLNHAVRDWLLHNRDIEGHNFGRGHISGMRFRPRGEPVSDIEKATMARKERTKDRPKPKHYSKHGYSGRPLCTANRKHAMYRRSNAWTTSKVEEVTCPRCKKLLAATPECAVV